MIRPVGFSFNVETAVNNAFQVDAKDPGTQAKALGEFNAFVNMLVSNGIDVTVVDDVLDHLTPDSIFPNNWISFHTDGTICLYPMYAPNRRKERKPEVLEKIRTQFQINRTIDLSPYESQDKFLEGTGSMVLDRENQIAYACLSPRTDVTVLHDFCTSLNYSAVCFDSVDEKGQAIYHTNVMMCVADRYVVVCLDSVRNPEQRKVLENSIKVNGKRIITINHQQMNHFAGNMLQLQNTEGGKYLVMSTQAYQSLYPDQIDALTTYQPILHSPLDTIETNGGGSARCMMAEVFLPEKNGELGKKRFS